MSTSESSDRSTFTAFTFRSLLLWSAGGAFAVLTVLYFTTGDQEAIPELWIDYGWFGAGAGWLLWKFRVSGASFRRMVGPLPRDPQIWTALHVVVPLIAFAFGALYLVYYPLSFAAPALVQSEFLIPEDDKPLHWLRDGPSVLLFQFLAPIVEELIYRGALLYRWAGKWGVRTAIYATSVVFALQHPSVLGALVFGLVLTRLYLRTGSLAIPIAVHILHNILLEAGAHVVPVLRGFKSLEQMHSLAPLGFLCLAVSVPWLLWFLRRQRIGDATVLPYYARASA